MRTQALLVATFLLSLFGADQSAQAQQPIPISHPIVQELAADVGLTTILLEQGVISLVPDPNEPGGWAVAVDCDAADAAVEDMAEQIEDAKEDYLYEADWYDYLVWLQSQGEPVSEEEFRWALEDRQAAYDYWRLIDGVFTNAIGIINTLKFHAGCP